MPISKKDKRRKKELNVIEKLDVLFATNFVIDDLFKEVLLKNCDKIVETNLPGIKKDSLFSMNYNIHENVDRYDCLFAGKFYESIRNPRYLLEVFCKLPSNYILHIAEFYIQIF